MGFIAVGTVNLIGRNPTSHSAAVARAAPWAAHDDACQQKLVRTWRPFGNANPLQRLLLRFVRLALANAARVRQKCKIF